ncbi:DUF397 domain-containing protein [Streptomyces inhibens]|uniref:DUF397 domain-containing protein n=1 Tax=Streptomyces inhibens TaxID=2293571 RepID=A0A371Q0R4_STRIH|nr:DUF397 domain-containing protein [Streptomyces inhibens]REK88342.1 DUF397 domain-containing protein [Streptomyces inhibens]
MASKDLDLSAAHWRKSSYSNGDGGECLEVAEGFLGAANWRKSSYSNAEGADCVEVADDFPGLVPVRDSKNPDGAALLIPAGAWDRFITAVKADLIG